MKPTKSHEDPNREAASPQADAGEDKAAVQLGRDQTRRAEASEVSIEGRAADIGLTIPTKPLAYSP